MNLVNLLLIVALFSYFIITFIYIRKRIRNNKAFQNLNKEEIGLLPWEKLLVEKIEFDKNYLKPIVYLSRVLLIIGVLALGYFIGAIALTLISGAIIIVLFNQKHKTLIHQAGVNYISTLNAFLDSYIPDISSGLSNDQAMLKYINGEEDEDLFDWWVNKDDPEYQVPIKWARVVEVYEMIRFNEERGIDDSLPIIEELQKDLNTKQEFYNQYKAKMGEINPILLSYYVFVPIIMLISFNQNKDFWFTFYGLLASIGMIILFLASQFIIFKVRESATKTIF